jgi:CBS domain-containing protein
MSGRAHDGMSKARSAAIEPRRSRTNPLADNYLILSRGSRTARWALNGFWASHDLPEAAMFISDVLRVKGYHVETIHLAASVELAVRKLAEHRIGALMVQDSWMKPIGIFSERDFINAIARDGAQVLGFEVQQLMSRLIISCHSSDRVDAMLARMTIERIRHLPVIDDRELKGIVSIGDLVKHRLDEKELEASVLLDISRMRS